MLWKKTESLFGTPRSNVSRLTSCCRGCHRFFRCAGVCLASWPGAPQRPSRCWSTCRASRSWLASGEERQWRSMWVWGDEANKFLSLLLHILVCIWGRKTMEVQCEYEEMKQVNSSFYSSRSWLTSGDRQEGRLTVFFKLTMINSAFCSRWSRLLYAFLRRTVKCKKAVLCFEGRKKSR